MGLVERCGNQVVAPLLARTTVQDFDMVNQLGAGIVLFINITAWSAGSLTISIRRKDPIASPSLYDSNVILTSAALAAVGLTVLRVYPAIPAVANLSASEVLPHDYNIHVAVADASSITYSIQANLIP